MKLKSQHLHIVILLSCLPLLCLACGGNKSNQNSNSAVTPETSGIDTQSSDEARIIEVVEQWNSSLNYRDLKKSKEVFADKVIFYTQAMSGDKVSELRIETASKDPSWQQSIVTDIEIWNLGDGLMVAAFTKQSNSNKGIHTYPAYLYLRQINGDWRIVKESDKVTDINIAKKKNAIPSDAIRGDFDGDGTIDHVWIEGKYDDEGYTIGKMRLRSENKNLDGLTWEAPRGVFLANVGDLNNSNRDFLGAIPLYDSNWTIYEVYGWKDGKWKSVLEPFSIGWAMKAPTEFGNQTARATSTSRLTQ